MKFINQVIIITLLFTSVIFSACEKNDIEEPQLYALTPRPANLDKQSTIEKNAEATEYGVNLICISVSYPFEVYGLNENIYAITDALSLEALLEDENDEIVDFVYPINIVNSDGLSEWVTDLEQLFTIVASCIPDSGWDELDNNSFPAFVFDDACVELVYPVNLLIDGGFIQQADDETELSMIITENLYTQFVLPLTLLNSDALPFVVGNTSELIDALISCNDVDLTVGENLIPLGVPGCFDVVYPVNVTLVDGTTESTNDEDELFNLFLSGQALDLDYPVQIYTSSGQNLAINSENEFMEALIDCGISLSQADLDSLILQETALLNSGSQTCYNIVYPISVQDGTTVINSQSEFETLLAGAATAGTILELDYPIEVEISSGGSNITLNSIEEIFVLIINCP